MTQTLDAIARASGTFAMVAMDQRDSLRTMLAEHGHEATAARVAAFKTGAVDWIDAVPPSMVDEVKKMPGVKTASFVSGNNLFLNFSTHLPNSPWRDTR